MTGTMYMGQTSGDLDQWMRIDFRSGRIPLRRAAQIKVAIQTGGPSMQGLIRIPGAPASNFDTGKGLTVVDLINVGDDANGYAEIVALEILFYPDDAWSVLLGTGGRSGRRDEVETAGSRSPLSRLRRHRTQS
jgi:hypothetical protein